MQRSILIRRYALSLVMGLLFGLAFGGASAQGLPWITRPGASETVSFYSDNAFAIDSITLDLSSLGLPDLPMTREFFTFTATFTVPENTAPGDYVIGMVLWDWTGQHRIESTLHVTRGILFESLAFNPTGVQPGGSTTLTAVVSPGNQTVASVTADLSSLGLFNSVPLEKTADDTWATTLQVPAGTPVGDYIVTATVREAAGEVFQKSARLQVYIPEPIHYSFGVGPSPIHAGREATASIFSEDALLLIGTTVDLSAFGLSSSVPLTFASGMMIAARFTVPEGTPPGDYPVKLNELSGIATLTVTIGPILTSVGFERSPVPPGSTATLTATVEPGVSPTARVTADLSAFGLPAALSIPGAAEPGKYSMSFIVPVATPDGGYSVPVTATDTAGRSHTSNAGLRVSRDVPLVVQSLTVEPSSARPGEAVTLAMTVEAYTGALATVTADLSAFGLSASEPLPIQSPTLRARTFTIPAGTRPGNYTITAYVWVNECYSQRFETTLTVLPPPGDVDASGAFTLADVAEVLRISAGISSIPNSLIPAGDVAGGNQGAGGAGGVEVTAPDGIITLADAITLARRLTGSF